MENKKIEHTNEILNGNISLPVSFVERMKSIAGDEFDDFQSSLNTASPVSIRLNTGIKSPQKEFDMSNYQAVAWCKSGIYLPERPLFTLDPLFHSGSYYVQEAASMFAEQCVNTAGQFGNIVYVLDLCAAPGGKSTHLASLFPDSLLVCNEVIRSRSAILEENLAKWGSPNTVVTSVDPVKFGKLGSFFDFILVDAPCSGEGMFRKDANALKNWSPEQIKHCAARQLRIVHDVWNSLKPGGFMLYSTCTYNIEENETAVRYITERLGAESIPVDISPFNGIQPSLNSAVNACRFFPHKTRSEGLFISLIKKHGELKPSNPRKSKQVGKFPDLRSWIKEPRNFNYRSHNDHIYLLPEKFVADVEFIGKTIHVISSGTEMCTVKGRELIPSLNFAHSSAINPANFPIWQIDKPTALKFLKKETLAAPAGINKGYVLLVYAGVPSGWVKNIGLRCNNLLPTNRKIRMEINT
ncbi:MAG: rRNA cytosine-C5-methyltransferase [Prevotellaceae bacterium]|jgi:16S rRNA C967 or C1407 C5-methylase (RsmB/RsmF family)|nr:rRNA cytosine-C5-methyltransferase [Prevotellaceae bacterium]